MKPVIFLDFDGVLNHRWWLSYMGSRELDPACMAVFNEIVRQSGADVVISSSWRIGRWLPQLQDILEGCGFAHKVLDKTPVGWRQQRGGEIMDWLVKNGRQDDPILIIDDSCDMVPYMHRLLRTSFESGLQPYHISLALDILGGTDTHHVVKEYFPDYEIDYAIMNGITTIEPEKRMKTYFSLALAPDGKVTTSTTGTNLVDQATQNQEYITQMAASGIRVIQLEVNANGVVTVVSNVVKP